MPLYLFFFDQCPQAGIKIHDIRHRNNGTSQHFFFNSIRYSDHFKLSLESKTMVKYIFELLTQVIISDLVGIYLLLKIEEIAYMLQRYDLLQNGKSYKMCYLIGRILFIYGFGNKPLFNIVAYHRSGKSAETQRLNAAIDIFCSLLQIKPHIGDLSVTRQTETAQGVRQYVFHFLAHIFIIPQSQIIVNTTAPKVFHKPLTRLFICDKMVSIIIFERIIQRTETVLKIQIVTDSSANLTNIDYPCFDFAPLTVVIGENQFTDSENMDLPGMLQTLKGYKGKTSTACPGVDDWLRAFGDADLVLGSAITSNLSGCYNSAIAAAQTYTEKYTDRRVFILDSLSTGPELELITEKYAEMVSKGLGFDEICEGIKEYSSHTHLLFSLASLENFARNGRVSPVVAKAVGVLGIRIIGRASSEGTLEPLHKARGEKKAIQHIITEMTENGFKGGKVRISHTNNPDFAAELKSLILARFPQTDISIRKNMGLCSYYAEEGGVLVGYET